MTLGTTDTSRLSPYSDWDRITGELIPQIGERAFGLFAYAVAGGEEDGPLAAHFRAALAAHGTDVANAPVTETEQLLIDWGRAVSATPAHISDEMNERLAKSFRPALRILLVHCVGLIVASVLVDELLPS